MGLVIIALVVIAGFYIFKGFAIVNEQERAVVLRFGSYSDTKPPGLRWNPPFIDTVFTVNVTQVREWSTNEQMLTKDLNIVDIKLSAQYAIADARNFALNVKDPEVSLRQAANSALRHVVGSNAMHDVLTEGRAQIGIDVQRRLQEYLDNYTTGIRVEKVNIEDSNPPREVQDAFDDVIKAREDEERYKNEAQAYANEIIPKSRGYAQQMIEQASAYKAEVIAKAEGEARRFELLLSEYELSPEVTRQRLYLDAMQEVMSRTTKVMVDVEGGNNMMYLPLDKLVETGRSVAASQRGVSQTDLEQFIRQQVSEQIRREVGNSSRARGGR